MYFLLYILKKGNLLANLYYVSYFQNSLLFKFVDILDYFVSFQYPFVYTRNIKKAYSGGTL